MAHILLIEPNQPLAEIYCAALKKAGHSVTARGQAQRAIAAADEKKPDVVVLELQLPGHSGVEFLYEFRSYKDWHGIPAVLHTLVPPHNLNMSKPMMDKLDIAAYLYKPAANLRTLVHTVEAALLKNASKQYV